MKFGTFNIICSLQTKNIGIRRRSDCWMFKNAILCNFLFMNKEIKKSLFIDDIWENFFYFRRNDTDIYTASYDLFINNTIRKITYAFIQLFLLFFCFFLLLAEVKILVHLTFIILSFVKCPLFLKFYFLKWWSFVIVDTHLIIRSEL